MTESRPTSSKSKRSFIYSKYLIEPSISDLTFKHECANFWPRRIFRVENEIDTNCSAQVNFEGGRFSRPISGCSNRIYRTERDEYNNISPAPWSDHGSQEKTQPRASNRLKSEVISRAKSAASNTVKVKAKEYSELKRGKEKSIYHLNQAQIIVPARPQTSRPLPLNCKNMILEGRVRPKTCGEFRSFQRPISAFNFNEKVIFTGISVVFPRRDNLSSARKSPVKAAEDDAEQVDLIEPIIADYRILQTKVKRAKSKAQSRECSLGNGGVFHLTSNGWNVGRNGRSTSYTFTLDLVNKTRLD